VVEWTEVLRCKLVQDSVCQNSSSGVSSGGGGGGGGGNGCGCFGSGSIVDLYTAVK